MKRYYFKLYENIHYDPHIGSRHLTNIRDSHFISFRDNPNFSRLLRDLTEEQSNTLDRQIAIEEEKTRRRLRLTYLHQTGTRRSIEDRPHNTPSSRSRNNSSSGGKKRRRRTRKI